MKTTRAMIGGMVASILAAGASPAVGQPITKERKPSRNVARGRGNQGDHHVQGHDFHTLPEHQDHNAAVEAKRQAKLAARKWKRAIK